MSRYIEYEPLMAELEREVELADDWKTAHEIANVAKYAPSIDIEPKRGEWVKRTHNTLIAQVNFAYCSECGQPIMHEHTRPLWNFCPNCGAKMDGEREGE